MPENTDLFEIIHTTRAMRRLKPDPVPDALVRKILDRIGASIDADVDAALAALPTLATVAEPTTDPEARLYRKGSGQPAKLCYGAHALMENRNGLLVDLRVEEANGYGERDTALAMLADAVRPSGGATVGADKAYDSKVFVEVSRSLGVTPHVARNTSRRSSAIDARTTRHAGYAVSQRVRKRVEEIFGWMKTVGNFRRTRFIGRKRTELAAHVVAAAYNLVRMTRLLPTLA